MLEGERDALREHAASTRTGKGRGAKGHGVRSGSVQLGSFAEVIANIATASLVLSGDAASWLVSKRAAADQPGVHRFCRRQHCWFQQPPLPVPLCMELSKPRRPSSQMNLQRLISSAVTPPLHSPQISIPSHWAESGTVQQCPEVCFQSEPRRQDSNCKKQTHHSAPCTHAALQLANTSWCQSQASLRLALGSCLKNALSI